MYSTSILTMTITKIASFLSIIHIRGLIQHIEALFCPIVMSLEIAPLPKLKGSPVLVNWEYFLNVLQ